MGDPVPTMVVRAAETSAAAAAGGTYAVPSAPLVASVRGYQVSAADVVCASSASLPLPLLVTVITAEQSRAACVVHPHPTSFFESRFNRSKTILTRRL